MSLRQGHSRADNHHEIQRRCLRFSESASNSSHPKAAARCSYLTLRPGLCVCARLCRGSRGFSAGPGARKLSSNKEEEGYTAPAQGNSPAVIDSAGKPAAAGASAADRCAAARVAAARAWVFARSPWKWKPSRGVERFYCSAAETSASSRARKGKSSPAIATTGNRFISHLFSHVCYEIG